MRNTVSTRSSQGYESARANLAIFIAQDEVKSCAYDVDYPFEIDVLQKTFGLKKKVISFAQGLDRVVYRSIPNKERIWYEPSLAPLPESYLLETGSPPIDRSGDFGKFISEFIDAHLHNDRYQTDHYQTNSRLLKRLISEKASSSACHSAVKKILDFILAPAPSSPQLEPLAVDDSSESTSLLNRLLSLNRGRLICETSEIALGDLRLIYNTMTAGCIKDPAFEELLANEKSNKWLRIWLASFCNTYYEIPSCELCPLYLALRRAGEFPTRNLKITGLTAMDGLFYIEKEGIIVTDVLKILFKDMFEDPKFCEKVFETFKEFGAPISCASHIWGYDVPSLNWYLLDDSRLKECQKFWTNAWINYAIKNTIKKVGQEIGADHLSRNEIKKIIKAVEMPYFGPKNNRIKKRLVKWLTQYHSKSSQMTTTTMTSTSSNPKPSRCWADVFNREYELWNRQEQARFPRFTLPNMCRKILPCWRGNWRPSSTTLRHVEDEDSNERYSTSFA